MKESLEETEQKNDKIIYTNRMFYRLTKPFYSAII